MCLSIIRFITDYVKYYLVVIEIPSNKCSTLTYSGEWYLLDFDSFDRG